MMETLEFSGLEISKMKDQVEGCHSQERETIIKTQWMDTIVQTIISIENIPGSKVGQLSRGLIREVVELSWIYCEQRFAPEAGRSRTDEETYDYNEGNKRRRRSRSPRRRSMSPLFITIPASSVSADLDDRDDPIGTSTLLDKNSNYTKPSPDMATYLHESLINLGIHEKQVVSLLFA